jgi:nitrate reductase NapE
VNEAEVAVTGRVPDTPANSSLRRTEEFRTWFFLTFVMAPVLAVLTVSGFGFVIWMYQLFAGPPGS